MNNRRNPHNESCADCHRMPSAYCVLSHKLNWVGLEIFGIEAVN